MSCRRTDIGSGTGLLPWFPVRPQFMPSQSMTMGAMTVEAVEGGVSVVGREVYCVGGKESRLDGDPFSVGERGEGVAVS